MRVGRSRQSGLSPRALCETGRGAGFYRLPLQISLHMVMDSPAKITVTWTRGIRPAVARQEKLPLFNRAASVGMGTGSGLPELRKDF